jgi:uncharacterized protein (TIGR00369 family)
LPATSCCSPTTALRPGSTVTTGLQISFLRKASLEDVVCEAELLKHGRTLTVADCRISTVDGRLIAHAEATYFMAEANQA